MGNLSITYSISNDVVKNAFEAELKKHGGIRFCDYENERMAVITEGDFEAIVADLECFVESNLFAKCPHCGRIITKLQNQINNNPPQEGDYAEWAYPVEATLREGNTLTRGTFFKALYILNAKG